SVITVETCVRVGSASSEVASTSTFCSTWPGDNEKSSSADWPTWRMTARVCFWKPVNSAETLYSPAGRAGTEYSPSVADVTVRVTPVAEFTTVIVGLDTLPPEESVTLPARVALTAWPNEEEEAASTTPATKMTTTACKHRVHSLRLTIHPPRIDERGYNP